MYKLLFLLLFSCPSFLTPYIFIRGRSVIVDIVAICTILSKGTKTMTDEQLQLYNKLTTLQKNVALCRVNMPLSSDSEVYKLGGGTANGANSISSTAFELLNNPAVVKFLDSFIVDKIDAAIMSRDAMIESLSHIADADIADIVEFTDHECIDLENKRVWQSTVHVRNMDELTTLQRKMIKSVKQTKYGIELTLHDAMQAKKQLAALCGYEAATKQEITVTKENDDKQLTDEEFADELKGMGIKFD